MRFWTRQHEAVWDELQKTGQYIVKKEYIEEKNDTISEFYLKLYEWYTKAARKYIDIPEVLKYPIWLSVSEDMMLQPAILTNGATASIISMCRWMRPMKRPTWKS